MQATSQRQTPYAEGILSAVGVGFFLLLIGVLFITISGLSEAIVSYLQGFRPWPVGETQVDLLAPIAPSLLRSGDAMTVYKAAEQFSVVWAVFTLVMLFVRFVVHSPIRKKAEELGNVVFWSGAAYLVQTLLISVRNVTEATVAKEWFVFWASIIVLIGISLIVRAIFLAAARTRPR